MTLDDRDEALLLALERNARASVVDLARRIGLSRSATQDRLARLERAGVIAAYTIARGTASAGPRLRAWLFVRNGAGGRCETTLPELARHPEIVTVHALAGEIDLLAEVSAADTADLDRIVQAIRLARGVESVETRLVLSTPFERRRKV